MKHVDLRFGSLARPLRAPAFIWACGTAGLSYGCLQGVELGERGTGGNAGAGSEAGDAAVLGTGGTPSGGSTATGGGAPDASAGSAAVGTGGVPGGAGRSGTVSGSGPGTAGAAGAPESVCGDGVLVEGEGCDDGNAIGGDGCSADCSEIGLGYACTHPGQPCELRVRCGDGVVQADEECDDGINDDSYGGCGHDCKPGPRCGDGVVQGEAGEQCDLAGGNGAPDSECGPGCTIVVL